MKLTSAVCKYSTTIDLGIHVNTVVISFSCNKCHTHFNVYTESSDLTCMYVCVRM